MDIDVEQLPDDTRTLKTMLVEQRSAYQELYEKFETLRRLYFGTSSEKLTEEDHRQMRLFNEAEELDSSSGETDSEESASLTVGEYRRKKPGRKAISRDLPREEIVHDVNEDEKKCRCCGEQRPGLKDETSEEIEIIPASVKVFRHIRKVYGPCSCKQFAGSEQPPVLRGEMAPRMIPGSIATPATLAYVITAKFVDALPLYRQEKIFSRLGVEMHRSTLANWVMATAARCGPLIDLLWEYLDEAVYHQMDETTVQVLHEPNRPPTAKSYIWVNLGHVARDDGHELKPIVVYHYHPSRSAEVVTASLENYHTGYVQTDGYEAYDKALAARQGVTHVGCLAHVRRKFFEAAKITKKPGSAQQALAFIVFSARAESPLLQRKFPRPRVGNFVTAA